MIDLGLWKYTKVGKVVADMAAKLGMGGKFNPLAYNVIPMALDYKEEEKPKRAPNAKINTAKVIQLYAKGHSQAEIARKLGIRGHGTVGRVLRRNGVVTDKHLKVNPREEVKEPQVLTFNEHQSFKSQRFADGSKAAAYERLIWAIRKNGNPSKVKVIHTYRNAEALDQGFRGNIRACALAIGEIKVSVRKDKLDKDAFFVEVVDV